MQVFITVITYRQRWRSGYYCILVAQKIRYNAYRIKQVHILDPKLLTVLTNKCLHVHSHILPAANKCHVIAFPKRQFWQWIETKKFLCMVRMKTQVFGGGVIFCQKLNELVSIVIEYDTGLTSCFVH